MMRVMLPDATGRMAGCEMTGKPLPEVPLGRNPVRVVYSGRRRSIGWAPGM